MQQPVIPDHINSRTKNVRTLKVLVGIIAAIVVFCVLYITVIYPSL
jgi:hypothetical protein